MNGEDKVTLGQLFDAKLEPIASGVEDLKRETKAMGTELTKLKTKFKFVGNCEEHKTKVDTVQRDVDRNNNRIWGLALVLLVAALGVCGKAFGWF